MPAKAAKKKSLTPGSRGRLISFEGAEGSGKSTQIARLTTRLEKKGHQVVVTREPGGTEIGEEIRHLIIHNSKSNAMSAEAELLLFAASRAQLVRELIMPSLDQGRIVVCDRYLDSTTVYQGVARRLSLDPVHQINQFAVGHVMPDLTVVLDVPAEVSVERIRQRVTDLPDRMERENIEFYRKVREGYLLLAHSLPERFFVVDGTQPPEKIERLIWKAVNERLA
jgi:dTMP kinase